MRSHNKKQTMTGAPLAIISMVLLLSMVLAMNGCTVGPDFAKPDVKLPENWSQKDNPQIETQNAVNSQWWKTFNDPTLDKLIDLAYKQNFTLQIAGLRILEARARLGVAIGQQYPQQQEIFGSAADEGLSKNAANNSTVDRFHENYQVGFDATWELDFWGKFRREIESTHASLIASMADYDSAIVSLTAEVARTYTVIRTFEALIALTEENVKVQQEGLRMAESRFRNGATTELDVTQARTLLESTKSLIPNLQTGLRQSQNALSTLLAQPVGTVQAMLDAPKGIPIAPPDMAVSIPAELLRRRPDIRSAELNAAAQCARIGIAKADLYPSFSLFGEVGVQTSSNGGTHSGNANFHNLFDDDSTFYSFGPGFNWPIFNYGRIENRVRTQDARFQQFLVNYQDTVLKATQEVEDATIAFLKAQQAAVFKQNSVNAAQRSVDLALIQYREGAVDYQRVLDTQRSLLQEQDSLTQTRSSIVTNLIALYKALGGGWELRQGRPVIAENMQAEMQKRTDWGNLLPLKTTTESLNQPTSADNTPDIEKTN